VRAVLAIPGLETLRNYSDAAEVPLREVAGVPLLIRVIATAARAGVDSVLVIWPEGLSSAIFEPFAESSFLKDVRVDQLVWQHAFDPRRTARWTAIAAQFEDQFLRPPWNWVTYTRALTELSPSRVRPLLGSVPCF